MTKLLIDARNTTPPEGWMHVQGLSRGWFVNGEINHDAVRAEAAAYPKDRVAIFESEFYDGTDPRQIEIVDTWREVNPVTRIGFYRTVPIRSYWAPIAGGQQERDWRIANAKVGQTRTANGRWGHRGLADVIDFLCPSLYAFYPPWMGGYRDKTHEELWFEKYAPKNIDVARNFGKQIYPYVWPRYHTTQEPLDFDFFRRQIQWCLDNCDGVVVWDWTGSEVVGEEIFPTITEIMTEFA